MVVKYELVMDQFAVDFRKLFRSVTKGIQITVTVINQLGPFTETILKPAFISFMKTPKVVNPAHNRPGWY